MSGKMMMATFPSSRSEYHRWIAFSMLSGWPQRPAPALHPSLSSVTFHEWLTNQNAVVREGAWFPVPPLTKPPMALKFQMWTLNQMLLFGAS